MFRSVVSPNRPRSLDRWIVVVSAALFVLGCGEDQAQLKDPGIPGGGDAGLSGDTGLGDAGNMHEPPPPPGVPSKVDTQLATQNPRLGKPIEVDCQMLDQNGNEVTPDTQPDWKLVYSPRDQFETENKAPRTLVPQDVGAARVGCAASNFSLVDTTPATFQVAPGPPHTVRISLDNDQVTAGTSVQASCRVFDKAGHELQDIETTVGVNAMGAGINVDGHKITIQKTGLYSVTCRADMAQREVPSTLEVTPGLPANITMTPSPQQSIYGLGEVVHFATIVQDEYGNQIRDAQIRRTVTPSATRFGRARWEFNAEGTYRVEASVEGPTKGGKQLTASAEITVNGEGPAISCDDPADASIVDAAPGDSVKMTGNVQDAHGVDTLKVDGETVSVANDGSFSTSLDTRYGINFVDLTATDKYGEQTSRTCAFLVADNWQDTGGYGDYLSDAVSLYLGQDALDDGNADDWQLDSLMDIVDTVLNSQGLLDELDSLLLTSNPIADDTVCYSTGLLWPSKICADYKIVYNSSGGSGGTGLSTGQNDVDMNWTSSGLKVSTTINDMWAALDVSASDSNNYLSCSPSGHVQVSSMDIDLSADIELDWSDEPHAKNINASVSSIGNVDPNFDGACGTLIDTIEDLNSVQNAIKNTLSAELEETLEDNVGPIVDDLFKSLDVSSFSTTLDVPNIAATANNNNEDDEIPIDFNVKFSRLETNSSRALVGIGTKFSARDIKHASGPSRVPLPGGQISHDPVTPKPIAGAIHVGTLNYALHALWRGGLFDAQLGNSLFGGSAPKGTSVDLAVDLPPVARRTGNGNVELMLGGASIRLVYPGLFDDPIEFEVGLVAKTGVSLQGTDKLNFNSINIKRLYFSPVGVRLDADSRAVVASFLKTLFQNVVDESLNSALPALPIPSFTLPPSLGQYGLTTGDELGLTDARLDGTSDHFILEGEFGKVY